MTTIGPRVPRTSPLTVECPICHKLAERGALVEDGPNRYFICEECVIEADHNERQILAAIARARGES